MNDAPATTSSTRKSYLDELRDAAKAGGVQKLKTGDGGWFQKLVTDHIAKHDKEIGPTHWDTLYPNLDAEERADREIAKATRRASAAGAAASVGASTGELLALVTDGLAAPIGVPAAAASMLAEAAYTARLQVDLACDLASIYGVPFDPNDFGEVATLFGLALEMDVKVKKEEREAEAEDKKEKHDKGVMERLIELEEGEIAKRVGRKLLEESILRNIIPVLGIGISARWNWVATKRFGAAAKKYARYRRALRAACTRMKVGTVSDPALLLEGAWLLATIDGEAEHEELLALSLILDALPVDRKDLHLHNRWDDEEDWFERVKAAPHDLHDPLLDVLFLIAATDRAIEPAERRFLKRLGKAIGRSIDQTRLDRLARHLSDGDDLPDGFLHCA